MISYTIFKGEGMTALKFQGEGSEYFKIWIVNVMLTIITLGLYYPWAKVRMKRYFYANTTLEGRSFEYHATGEQLFKGYLIAMVLFIVYAVISQVSPVGGLVVLGVLFLAIPWVVWRSMKFNMLMTSFSNVRFSFHGGLKAAYINFFLYPALFFLSIYITPILLAVMQYTGKLEAMAAILPLVGLVSMGAALYMFGFMKQRNTGYLMGNIRYGQGVFSTDYKVSEFIVILVKTSIIGMVVILLVGLVFGGGAVALVGVENLVMLQEAMEQNTTDANITAMNVADSNLTVGMEKQETVEKISKTVMPLLTILYGGFILSGIIIAAFWIAQQREYVYRQTVLDNNVTFQSTLKAIPLAWVMVSNLVLVLLTAGLAYPWTKVRLASLMAENTYVDIPDGLDVYTTQKQEEESSLGEQIGDAFDIDIDIGF